MEKICVERSGAPPLVFAGEKVSESAGRWLACREQECWHRLALYQAANHRCVVAIETRWRADDQTFFSWAEFLDPWEVADFLDAWGPCRRRSDLPDCPYLADHPSGLVTAVEKVFRLQAAELLATAPGIGLTWS